MIAVNINITDTATPAIEAKIKQVGPQTVATRITPPVREHWRQHLANLPRNKSSWPSTSFWQQAARSVQGVASGGVAIISADKIGLAQRLYGGTIKARNAKNLTIPICAEAYGTTVADWGMDNLVLVITSNGFKFLALWLGSEAAQNVYRKQLGKLEDAFNPDLTDAQRKSAQNKLWKYSYTTTARVAKVRAGLSAGATKPKVIIFKGKGGSTGSETSKAARWNNLKFLFLLKESVFQTANPNVLPPDLQEFVIAEVNKAVSE